MKVIIICLSWMAICLADESKFKRNAAVNVNHISPYAARRQAWECHPGCRKFCLPSCKRSCCFGAPNYTPQMFPKLIQYQSSISNPPQLPPACPAYCNPSCYPNCDSGCCQTQPMQPVQAQAYNRNTACSSACAPDYSYACCHSRPLELHNRLMVPGAPMKAHDQPAKPVKPAPAKPPTEQAKRKTTFEKSKDGKVCLRKCQNLCNPKCRFECCLPTHRHFDDDPPPPVEHHVPAPPPKVVDRKAEQLKQKLRDNKYIHPLAMPQRVQFPSLYKPTPPPRPYRPPARRPYRMPPCRPGSSSRARAPCIAPTSNPFGQTTDPFENMDFTEPFGMDDNVPPTQAYYPPAAPGACPSQCPRVCILPSCNPLCCNLLISPPAAPAPAPVPVPPPPVRPPPPPPVPPPPVPVAPPPPVMPPPMPVPQLPPPEPLYAGSPGLLPLGQAPTTCSAGCSEVCAPTCSEACCQEFPQVVHIPPASEVQTMPEVPSPGLAPLGQALTVCPGSCPSSCAPACVRQCCLAPQVVHVPPVHMTSVHAPPVHLAPAHPAPVHPNAVPMHSGSPGLKPLGMASTCPGQCPNLCAPTCSSSCCGSASVPPSLTCPSSDCPNSCAPACTPKCCANNDDPLPSNWDRRSYINKILRKK